MESAVISKIDEMIREKTGMFSELCVRLERADKNNPSESILVQVMISTITADIKALQHLRGLLDGTIKPQGRI